MMLMQYISVAVADVVVKKGGFSKMHTLKPVWSEFRTPPIRSDSTQKIHALHISAKTEKLSFVRLSIFKGRIETTFRNCSISILNQ